MPAQRREIRMDLFPDNSELTGNAIDHLAPPRPLSAMEKKMSERAVFDGFSLMGNAQEAAVSAYLRNGLKAKIIGQDDTIDAIVRAYDRAEVRPKSDPRPVATLAFLGPTGTGKSEAAQTLAALTGGSKDQSLIKIDCSGFSHGHEIASLVGSPPGYTGRGQEPVFAEGRVASCSVVLFDEIEKGSPELYRLMLQIMGDGKLQLNNGDVADFRDVTIIMTSNLGAKEMAVSLSDSSLGFATSQKKIPNATSLRETALRSFNDYFAPEFINRIDKSVVFQPHTAESLTHVLTIKLNDLNTSSKERFGVMLSLSDATQKHLVERAMTNAHLGARPLIREFEDQVQTQLGRYIGNRSVCDGTHVRVFHSSEIDDGLNEDLVFMSTPEPSLRKTPTVAATSLIPYVRAEDTEESVAMSD